MTRKQNEMTFAFNNTQSLSTQKLKGYAKIYKEKKNNIKRVNVKAKKTILIIKNQGSNTRIKAKNTLTR